MAGAYSESSTTDERAATTPAEHHSFTLDFALLFVVTLVLALAIAGVSL